MNVQPNEALLSNFFANTATAAGELEDLERAPSTRSTLTQFIPSAVKRFTFDEYFTMEKNHDSSSQDKIPVTGYDQNTL